MSSDDVIYMERALALARHGELHASPNPMVGAVIVADGRVIGEGWHRRCGEGHAEVNAIASVREADRPLLSGSTMYVTLEPCSHYGKTPPCANLIVRTGIPRVVVAATDPFEKVSGRGIALMRAAGIDVETGLLEAEARDLNRRFFTSHTLKRPYVTLKWAQSSDGYIDGRLAADSPAAAISTPLTRMMVHRERALNDAILCGSETYLRDHPSLTVRDYAGHSPRRFVADRRGRLNSLPQGWTALAAATPEEILHHLYHEGLTSLLVEGGFKLLESFISSSLFDEARVEVNRRLTLGDMPLKTPAPTLPLLPESSFASENAIIYHFVNHRKP